MIPRTVQMAKVVADIVGEPAVEANGNIIGPALRGWSNLYHSYFLGEYGDTLGNPVSYSYRIHSWSASGNPRWSQPPSRKLTLGFGNILCPNPDSTTPPPLNEVTAPVI